MAVSIYLSQPIYISKYISSCIYFQVTLDAVGCPSCPDVGSDRFLMLLFFFMSISASNSYSGRCWVPRLFSL